MDKDIDSLIEEERILVKKRSVELGFDIITIIMSVMTDTFVFVVLGGLCKIVTNGMPTYILVVTAIGAVFAGAVISDALCNQIGIKNDQMKDAVLYLVDRWYASGANKKMDFKDFCISLAKDTVVEH